MKTHLLSFALALCLPASATAGTIYTFAPLEGRGFADSPLGGMGTPFAGAAELTIRYDPADPSHDWMDLSANDIGIGIMTLSSLTYTLVDSSLILGGYGTGSVLDVTLTGVPGPLTPTGLPLSLDGFATAGGFASGRYPSPGGSFVFFFATVPEPSSWLLLAAGIFGAIGLVSLAQAWLPYR